MLLLVPKPLHIKLTPDTDGERGSLKKKKRKIWVSVIMTFFIVQKQVHISCSSERSSVLCGIVFLWFSLSFFSSVKFNAILIKSPVGWLSYLRRKKFNYGHRAFPSCIRMFFSLLKVKQSCKKTIFFCSPFSIFPVSSLSSCLLCFHILFIFFQFSFPTFSLWFFFSAVPFRKISLLLEKVPRSFQKQTGIKCWLPRWTFR